MLGPYFVMEAAGEWGFHPGILNLRISLYLEADLIPTPVIWKGWKKSIQFFGVFTAALGGKNGFVP